MSLENERHYLYREAITNPHGPQKSPWHVVVTSVFPDRVAVTNPNNKLSGRAQINELLETAEIPLLGRKDDAITIPPEMIERIVEVVEVFAPDQRASGANPFEN